MSTPVTYKLLDANGNLLAVETSGGPAGPDALKPPSAEFLDAVREACVDPVTLMRNAPRLVIEIVG